MPTTSLSFGPQDAAQARSFFSSLGWLSNPFHRDRDLCIAFKRTLSPLAQAEILLYAQSRHDNPEIHSFLRTIKSEAEEKFVETLQTIVKNYPFGYEKAELIIRIASKRSNYPLNKLQHLSPSSAKSAYWRYLWDYEIRKSTQECRDDLRPLRESREETSLTFQRESQHLIKGPFISIKHVIKKVVHLIKDLFFTTLYTLPAFIGTYKTRALYTVWVSEGLSLIGDDIMEVAKGALACIPILGTTALKLAQLKSYNAFYQSKKVAHKFQ